jgi:hypothetical protein
MTTVGEQVTTVSERWKEKRKSIRLLMPRMQFSVVIPYLQIAHRIPITCTRIGARFYFKGKIKTLKNIDINFKEAVSCLGSCFFLVRLHYNTVQHANYSTIRGKNTFQL